jgi:hypothetical protein
MWKLIFISLKYMTKKHSHHQKSKITQFKKFVRTHMPHFHFAWHAKVDIHLFRVIFVGLGVILLIVFVIILANINTIRQYSTGTFADEQTRNDKLPKTIWVEPKPYDEGSWIVLIKPEKPQERTYVSYVVMIDNIYNGEGQRQMQFSNFLFRKNVDGGEEGIELTDISRQGDRYIGVARLSYNKEGETLPEFQPLFEVRGAKPDISSAYLYYLEGDGSNIDSITGFKEEALTVIANSSPADPSDVDPALPPRPDGGEGVSDCQEAFGGEYVKSYWYEEDGGQCNCTTGDQSEHKILFGIEGMEEQQAKERCELADLPDGVTNPDFVDPEIPPRPENTEPEPTLPSTDRALGTFTIAQANEYCTTELVRIGVEEEGHAFNYFRGCFPGDDGNVGVCGLESKYDCDSNCGDERYLVDAPAALCRVDVLPEGGGSEESSDDTAPDEEADNGADRGQAPRAGGCPEGYEPYLDDFSSDRDMCICNNDPEYTEVDMSYCKAGANDQEIPPQSEDKCPSNEGSHGCGDRSFNGCFCGSDGQYWESCGSDEFQPVGGSCTPLN